MADISAIVAAVAARFASGVVTPPAAPGGTYENIRSSVADPPNQLGPLPCVVVFTESADMDHKVGVGSRFMTLHFKVRFYYNQTVDMERDNGALRRWATVLQDQLKTTTQLGGAVNGWARVDGWTIGQMTYAGIPYSGLELDISATHTEGWAAS